MNRITIMIPGTPARSIEFREGETLSAVVDRVASEEFPIHKVQSWYCDALPISEVSSFELRNGQSLGGTPKIEGGTPEA